MSQTNVRERLLEAGIDTLHRCGFNGCGVQQITQAAGVPKGSFYNHFASKEALGAAVLERYWQRRRVATLPLLDDESLAPVERLRRYFAVAAEMLAGRGYACGCLIGNLGAELSDQSTLVCDRLAAVFADWSQALARCIAEGQEAGEIRSDLDAAILAAFLVDAWEGAILRTRVEKCGRPLASFQEIVFATLLSPSPVPNLVRDQP